MSTVPIMRNDFNELKIALHRKLLQKLNLEKLTQVDRDAVKGELVQIIEGLVVGEATQSDQARASLGEPKSLHFEKCQTPREPYPLTLWP